MKECLEPFFTSLESLFGQFSFGNVVNDSIEKLFTINFDGGTENLNIPNSAVFSTMGQYISVMFDCFRCFSVFHCCFRLVGVDFVDMHRRKFFKCPAIKVHCCFIGVSDIVGVGVDNQHGG